MSTLAWLLIAAIPFAIVTCLFAWVLCRSAAIGDEMENMRRLAELGREARNGVARNGVEILGYEPEYQPVSRRHWRGL